MEKWNECISDCLAHMRNDLARMVANGTFYDVVFIGNNSTLYKWIPCRMIDFDAFIFLEELDRGSGIKLVDVARIWARRLEIIAVDFELRIIEGPYKPEIARLTKPTVVAHLGVFTIESYLNAPDLKRWAWRKYEAIREKALLNLLAPPKPDVKQLIYGRKGLKERFASIAAGSVEMEELSLPNMTPTRFNVEISQSNFNECCFAYAANSARNYARVMGHEEADILGNNDFFLWFDRTIIRSPELLELMEYKRRARDEGFVFDTELTRRLALEVITTLLQHALNAERRLEIG